MIELRGDIRESDYVGAQYLHSRARRIIAAMGVIILILGVAVTVLNVMAWRNGSKSGSDSMMFPFLAALLVGYLFVFRPWWYRRIYRKQPSLHEPVSVDIGEGGLAYSSEHGQGEIPWRMFIKWRSEPSAESGKQNMVYRIRPLVLVAVLTVLACFNQSPQQESETPASQSTKSERDTDRGTDDGSTRPIEVAIPTPPGYERIAVASESFGAWLRELPVRPGRPPVRLYDGRKKANQTAHHVVLDVDVGDKDLQQCADAVIRLRAEYLFAGPCRDSIRFNFTSGDVARWTDWRAGMRPVVSGNAVSWEHSGAVDGGYSDFRDYLDTVFMYAGSASLEQELASVADTTKPEIGDVFIEGGFPGHAVLVVDVAKNGAGKRIFLLAQSYMPAQEVHILRSPEDINPWYRAQSQGVLRTPEWEFYYNHLKRFPQTDCEANGGQAPN